jgi:hypothetical protein
VVGWPILSVSLALTASSVPHIAFSQGAGGILRHAYFFNGVVWVTNIVDSAYCTDASLAIGPTGEIHVSYIETGFTNYSLRHAWKAGNQWTIEAVDSIAGGMGFAPSGTSIEVDTANDIHIAYGFNGGFPAETVSYAKKSGGAWTTERVDNAPKLRNPALALDSSNAPRIVYEKSAGGGVGLKYAEKTGGAWTTAFADSGFGIGAGASIAIDAQGLPHISCEGGSGAAELDYVRGYAAVTGVESGAPARPALLTANAPNPFSETTRIRFELPERSPVRLEVFDAAGRLVRALVDAPSAAAGAHEAVWDGRSAHGDAAPAGVYFYRIRSGRLSETREIVLVR